MTTPKLQIYQDAAGEYRWRLKVGRRITADSGEGHTRKDNAVRAARRLIVNAASAVLEFQT